MKKLLLTLMTTLIFSHLMSQCAGVSSANLLPPAPAGGYLPGTVVTVCYTMQGWNGNNFGTNWLEGFDLNLGPGWTGLTPGAAPPNISGTGDWVWLNTTTSATTGQVVGPGWFYDYDGDGLAGDDWGDNGNAASVWNFCFTATVSNDCNPQNLQIQVAIGADGDWGNWLNNQCNTPTFNAFNGMSNPQPFVIGPMSHN
jgi:hypothetical protein